MTSSLAEPQCFDRVESLDGATRMSAATFFALALPDRIRFLLTSRPRFFRGDVEVPRSEALKLR